MKKTSLAIIVSVISVVAFAQQKPSSGSLADDAKKVQQKKEARYALINRQQPGNSTTAPAPPPAPAVVPADKPSARPMKLPTRKRQ